MKKKQVFLITIGLVMLLLVGCSNEPYVYEEGKNKSVEIDGSEKTITLHVEQRLSTTLNDYRFGGFVNDSTITFIESGERNNQVYHPGTIGTKFKLAFFRQTEFEIVEANREKGYIKLKMTTKK